jgi:predicted Zn-dependent protease
MVSPDRHDPQAAAGILDRVLGMVRGGEAEAAYTARDAALTRFANSQVHQNVVDHDATLRVRLVADGRTGVAATNRLDDEGLRAVVASAAAIRDRAARNPETPPLAEGPATGHSRLGWSDATASADPALRAAGARAAIEAAVAAGLEASGAFSTDATTMAIANTRGLRSSGSTTEAKMVTVVMGADGGSGYAQAVNGDVGRIDAAAIGAEAVDRALRSAGATDLEPGEYPVLLEPYAVATLIEYTASISFSALAAQESRTFMELGRPVMGPQVRIWDDGQDPAGLPSTFDYEGVRKQRVDLVTDGVATGLVHDTRTALRAGIASTGHALPAPNTWGPIPWNLFMAGGSEDRDALLARLDRGIWVTRFHYVNVVHAKRAILTGMTKDGTFLVEGGRVVRPIRNFRFTQSVPEAFSRIVGLGGEPRLVAPEYSGINVSAPALLIDRFGFTGATAAEEAA